MPFQDILPDQAAAYKAGLAYQDLFPFQVIDYLIWWCTIASAVWVIYRVMGADVRYDLAESRGKSPSSTGGLVVAGLGLVTVLLVNAVLCGVFSGVNDRYQARLIWLLPVYACLALTQWGVFRVAGVDAVTPIDRARPGNRVRSGSALDRIGRPDHGLRLPRSNDRKSGVAGGRAMSRSGFASV